MRIKRGIEDAEVTTIVLTGPHRAEIRGPAKKKKPPITEVAADRRPKVAESVLNFNE